MECRLPHKEFKNRDILTSISCTYKIYLTINRNIIICIGIYKKILFNLCFQAEIQSPALFSRPGQISRHTCQKILYLHLINFNLILKNNVCKNSNIFILGLQLRHHELPAWPVYMWEYRRGHWVRILGRVYT